MRGGARERRTAPRRGRAAAHRAAGLRASLPRPARRRRRRGRRVVRGGSPGRGGRGLRRRRDDDRPHRGSGGGAVGEPRLRPAHQDRGGERGDHDPSSRAAPEPFVDVREIVQLASDTVTVASVLAVGDSATADAPLATLQTSPRRIVARATVLDAEVFPAGTPSSCAPTGGRSRPVRSVVWATSPTPTGRPGVLRGGTCTWISPRSGRICPRRRPSR